MKKLLLLTFIIYLTSCSNPEDRATGNADSSSFTKSGKVLNSKPGPTDPKSQSGVEKPDSSANPSSMKENNNGGTNGTNRSYGKSRDTTKQ